MPLINPAHTTPTQSPEAVFSALTVPVEPDISSDYVDLGEECGDSIDHDFEEISLADAVEASRDHDNEKEQKEIAPVVPPAVTASEATKTPAITLSTSAVSVINIEPTPKPSSDSKQEEAEWDYRWGDGLASQFKSSRQKRPVPREDDFESKLKKPSLLSLQDSFLESYSSAGLFGSRQLYRKALEPQQQIERDRDRDLSNGYMRPHGFDFLSLLGKSRLVSSSENYDAQQLEAGVARIFM